MKLQDPIDNKLVDSKTDRGKFILKKYILVKSNKRGGGPFLLRPVNEQTQRELADDPPRRQSWLLGDRNGTGNSRNATRADDVRRRYQRNNAAVAAARAAVERGNKRRAEIAAMLTQRSESAPPTGINRQSISPPRPSPTISNPGLPRFTTNRS